MSSKKIQPRPEQIAALTSGIYLPLAPLNDKHMFVITDCLTNVWKKLVDSSEINLQEQDEDEITTLIQSHLNNLLDPLWKMLVLAVTRDSSMMSFDGSHLKKQPDLSLLLTPPRQPTFPLIIECKLIDTKTKHVRLYCNKGLTRFVNDEYAWYDRQAIMLAYVRDASTIATSLTPHLSKHRNKETDPFACEQLPEAIETTDMDLARSKHGRNFHYDESRHPNVPGPIVVWHLWVSDQCH